MKKRYRMSFVCQAVDDPIFRDIYLEEILESECQHEWHLPGSYKCRKCGASHPEPEPEKTLVGKIFRHKVRVFNLERFNGQKDYCGNLEGTLGDSSAEEIAKLALDEAISVIDGISMYSPDKDRIQAALRTHFLGSGKDV